MFAATFCAGLSILGKAKPFSFISEVLCARLASRLLACSASCQRRPQRLTARTKEFREMWRKAGREARHGGRSGPPRLRPAVLLSCSSPFCEQSRHREEGEHRGGGGLWSTSVTLLHIIWESGGKEGFVRQGGTDWQTKGDLRFDVLSQKTVVLLSAPPEHIL